MTNQLMVAYHEGRMDAFTTVLSNGRYLGLSPSAAAWLSAQFEKEMAAKRAEDAK